jgi:hypothetical protein
MRFCVPFVGLLMLCVEMSAAVAEKAGTTIANAPYIVDTMDLTVQSGANYIRIEPKYLPATVIYIPDALFGLIPEVIIMGDTLPKQLVFDDCLTVWKWTIPERETTAMVEIAAHEVALIQAAPMVETVENRITETACDSFVYEGVKYTESGEYTVKTEKLPSGETQVTILELTINHTLYEEETVAQYTPYTAPSGKVFEESGIYLDTVPMSNGCNRIITIKLTIMADDDQKADTVYFCRGFNTEHDEIVSDGYVRRYRPYVFQSPAEWDFMEGVILDGEHERTLLDLKRAEKNLYDHYTGELTPVGSIRWSVLYDGQGQYVPLTVTNDPQWIATGHVAVQVYFLCGEMYNTEFPTDIDQVSLETVSTKRIENGRVVIIRGGAKYDVFGTKIH